jgi:membrane protein YdbS with pleckstrin-like domain
MNGENTENGVLYRTGCHWAMFFGPLLLIVIGGLAFSSQGLDALALVAFGIIWGFFAYRSLQRSQIRLTGDRLLVDAGFLRVVSYDIPLDKIMAIEFYQPSLGSMLSFGKIMIDRAGARRHNIRFVSDPAELVMRVRQQIAALKASQKEE